MILWGNVVFIRLGNHDILHGRSLINVPRHSWLNLAMKNIGLNEQWEKEEHLYIPERIHCLSKQNHSAVSFHNKSQASKDQGAQTTIVLGKKTGISG